MKAVLVATVVAAMGLAGPRQAAAQQPRGFITFGISSDANEQHFPGIGGGVLFDLAKSWVSVGGQGDIFLSNGSVAGRGGPIAQANRASVQDYLQQVGGFDCRVLGYGQSYAELTPMLAA